MSKVLVLADIYDGQLRRSTLATISCAKQLVEFNGGDFEIVAIGSGVEAHAETLGGFGASKVHLYRGETIDSYSAESWALAIRDLGNSLGVTHYLAPAGTLGKDCMPRVAALVGAGMAADIISVQKEADGTVSYRRPMWAGNILATVVVDTSVQVLTARAAEFSEADAADGQSEVVSHTWSPSGTLKSRFSNFEASGGERPDLGEAVRVVSGGRGLKDEETFWATVTPLADVLGAAIGATRAAVDSGFAPNDLQVGQTGRVVAPDLYFAVAISGAIQHLAGIKNSRCIVAINKDPEAPIFQVADYGLVADAFKALPELVEELKSVL